MTRRVFSITVVVVVVLGGCGGKNKVGDKSLLNFKDQSQQQLDQSTTSTAGPGSGPATTAAPSATTAARQTTTTARTATTVAHSTETVTINNDNAASAFDPAELKVAVGTTITWVNHDTVARSVKSDDEKTFVSPPIPPGGSWSYPAATAGQFNYHDGTRPYAIGSLEVVR